LSCIAWSRNFTIWAATSNMDILTSLEANMRPHLASLVDDFHKQGNATALVTYRGNRRTSVSYGEIASLARRFAAELRQRQIESGERVLLWGQNSSQWIGAFF